MCVDRALKKLFTLLIRVSQKAPFHYLFLKIHRDWVMLWSQSLGHTHTHNMHSKYSLSLLHTHLNYSRSIFKSMCSYVLLGKVASFSPSSVGILKGNTYKMIRGPLRDLIAYPFQTSRNSAQSSSFGLQVDPSVSQSGPLSLSSISPSYEESLLTSY